MSTIFGITEDKMKETSSTFTLTEIYQQPATWEKTCRQIEENKEELQKFIDQVIKCDDFDVILTGAGTSEFVGNALFAHLSGLLNLKAKDAEELKKLAELTILSFDPCTQMDVELKNA